MQSKPSLRGKPPALPDLGDPRLAAFLDGADRRPEAPAAAPAVTPAPAPVPAAQPAVAYPWEQPGLRADVLKLYNLRLPEPYLEKLRYISEHTPHSMQRFCLEVLLPAIDARIEEITGRR